MGASSLEATTSTSISIQPDLTLHSSSPRLATHLLDGADNILSGNDLPKDDMLIIQPWR
jgi:hypothetical protein